MSISLPCTDPSCLVLFIPEVVTDCFLKPIREANVVYTTRFNKWFLTHVLQIDGSKIFCCKFNQNYSIKNRFSCSTYFLTAISSNFSPGSAIFVWKDEASYKIYLGPFRNSQEVLLNPLIQSLIEKEEHIVLRIVDSDSTFGAVISHKVTECQVDTELICKLIRREQEKKPEHIVLGVPLFGFEKFLKKLAEKLQVTLHVDERRAKIFSYLNLEGFYDTQQNSDRIEVKSLESFSLNLNQKKVTFSEGCLFENSLYIKIGSVSHNGLTEGRIQNGSNTFYFLPHTHAVLQDDFIRFLEKLKPDQIVGLPPMLRQRWKIQNYTKEGDRLSDMRQSRNPRILSRGILKNYKTNPDVLPKDLQEIFSHSPRQKSNSPKCDFESFSGLDNELTIVNVEGDSEKTVELIQQDSELYWKKPDSVNQSKLTSSNLTKNKVSEERNKLMQSYLASESERLKGTDRIGSVPKTVIGAGPETRAAPKRVFIQVEEQKITVRKYRILKSPPHCKAYANEAQQSGCDDETGSSVSEKGVAKFPPDNSISKRAAQLRLKELLKRSYRPGVAKAPIPICRVVLRNSPAPPSSEVCSLRAYGKPHRQSSPKKEHTAVEPMGNIYCKSDFKQTKELKNLLINGTSNLCPVNIESSNSLPFYTNGKLSYHEEIHKGKGENLTHLKRAEPCTSPSSPAELLTKAKSEPPREKSCSPVKKRSAELDRLVINGTPNLCPVNCKSLDIPADAPKNEEFNSNARRKDESKKSSTNPDFPEKKKLFKNLALPASSEPPSSRSQTDRKFVCTSPKILMERKLVRSSVSKSLNTNIAPAEKKRFSELDNLFINGTPNLCPVNCRSESPICDDANGKIANLVKRRVEDRNPEKIRKANGAKSTVGKSIKECLQVSPSKTEPLENEGMANGPKLREKWRVKEPETNLVSPPSFESEADSEVKHRRRATRSETASMMELKGSVNMATAGKKARRDVRNLANESKNSDSSNISDDLTLTPENQFTHGADSNQKCIKRKLEYPSSDSSSSVSYSKKLRKYSESSYENSQDSPDDQALPVREQRCSNNVLAKLNGIKTTGPTFKESTFSDSAQDSVGIENGLSSKNERASAKASGEESVSPKAVLSPLQGKNLKELISNEFKSVLVRKMEAEFKAGFDASFRRRQPVNNSRRSKLQPSPPSRELENLTIEGTSKLCAVNVSDDDSHVSSKLRVTKPKVEGEPKEAVSSPKCGSESDVQRKTSAKAVKKLFFSQSKELENLAIDGTEKLCASKTSLGSDSQILSKFRITKARMEEESKKLTDKQKSIPERDAKMRISEKLRPNSFSSRELENLTIDGTAKMCSTTNSSSVLKASPEDAKIRITEGLTKKPLSKELENLTIDGTAKMCSLISSSDVASQVSSKLRPKTETGLKKATASPASTLELDTVVKTLDKTALRTKSCPSMMRKNISDLTNSSDDDCQPPGKCRLREGDSRKLLESTKKGTSPHSPVTIGEDMVAEKCREPKTNGTGFTDSGSKKLCTKNPILKVSHSNSLPSESSYAKKRFSSGLSELKKLAIEGTRNLCPINITSSHKYLINTLSHEQNFRSKEPKKCAFVEAVSPSKKLDNDESEQLVSHLRNLNEFNPAFASRIKENLKCSENSVSPPMKLGSDNSNKIFSGVENEDKILKVPKNELECFEIKEEVKTELFELSDVKNKSSTMNFWDDLTGIDITRIKQARKSRRSRKNSIMSSASSVQSVKESPLRHFLSHEIKEELINGMRRNLSDKVQRFRNDKQVNQSVSISPSKLSLHSSARNQMSQEREMSPVKSLLRSSFNRSLISREQEVSPKKSLLRLPSNRRLLSKEWQASSSKRSPSKSLLKSPSNQTLIDKGAKVNLIENSMGFSKRSPGKLSQFCMKPSFKPYSPPGVKVQKAKRLTPFKTMKVLVDCLKENTHHVCNLDLSGVSAPKSRSPKGSNVKQKKGNSAKNLRFNPCSVVVEDIQEKIEFCRTLGLELASLIPKQPILKTERKTNLSFYQFPRRFKRWKRKPNGLEYYC